MFLLKEGAAVGLALAGGQDRCILPRCPAFHRGGQGEMATKKLFTKFISVLRRLTKGFM